MRSFGNDGASEKRSTSTWVLCILQSRRTPDDWFTTIEDVDRPLLWGLSGADQVLGYAVQLHVAALRDAAENREGLIGR